MAGTVVAVFDDNAQAERAAQALMDDGVPLADITLVFHGAAGETGTPDAHSPPDTDTLATGVREVETHDVERPVNAVDEIAPRAIVGFVIGAPLMSLAAALLVFFDTLETYIAAHALATAAHRGPGRRRHRRSGRRNDGRRHSERSGEGLPRRHRAGQNAGHDPGIERQRAPFPGDFAHQRRSQTRLLPALPGQHPERRVVTSAPRPPKTSEEAVEQVLTHIERQAGRADPSAAFDGLLRIPDLPLDRPDRIGQPDPSGR